MCMLNSLYVPDVIHIMCVLGRSAGCAYHASPTKFELDWLHTAHFQLGSFLIGLVSNWAQF